MRSVNSSSVLRPSTDSAPGPVCRSSATGSYSSVMSPTSSSTRSSMVTMPAVPPYSSSTIARCDDPRRISLSARSTGTVSGRDSTGRATSRTGRVRLLTSGSSRSRTCTKPMMSSADSPITG